MAGLLSPMRPVVEITTRGDAVSAELRRWAAEPFDMASANCGLSVVAFAEGIVGLSIEPSPRDLGPLRMLALAADPTAFELYARWCLEQLGCPVTDEPRRGDIGLLELANGLTACLCVGRLQDGRSRWAARMVDGIVIELASPLVAWRVECPTR